MAQLTVQPLVRAGLNPTMQAAAGGGDSFLNNPGRTWVRVVNGGGSSITVTMNSQENCNQGFDHDDVDSVPAGGERWFGPFPSRFNDSNGLVQMTYSGVTSVTVGAFSV